MHEQEGRFPESIYYLRKLQWEIGGNHLDDKIEQLMDKANRERLSSGESWSPVSSDYYSIIGAGGLLG